jgi:hypothetical protein
MVVVSVLTVLTVSRLIALPLCCFAALTVLQVSVSPLWNRGCFEKRFALLGAP